MWDNFNKKKSVTVVSFQKWLENFVLVPEMRARAQEAYQMAESVDDVFLRLKGTPQTAVHHAEGPSVVDGVLRALAGLFAVAGGAPLHAIEAFAQEKHFNEEVQSLADTMHEHIATLTVYLLIHDVGKIQTLVLDAPAGSLGEKEGFAQHKQRKKIHATEEERLRFGKLYRAFVATKQDRPVHKQMADFFDTYEIHAHYPGHAKQSSLIDRTIFNRLCDHYRIVARQRELILFMVAQHMNVIRAFDSVGEPRQYELLMTRIQKAGFDADEVIDLIMAAVFLDACVGSLPYKHGSFTPSVDLIIHMFRAEEQVAPHRRSTRRARHKEQEKRRLRHVLHEAKLDGAALFDLLHTPFGKERARIVAQVQHLVQHPSERVDFETHKDEMQKRIEHARRLFDAMAKP